MAGSFGQRVELAHRRAPAARRADPAHSVDVVLAIGFDRPEFAQRRSLTGRQRGDVALAVQRDRRRQRHPIARRVADDVALVLACCVCPAHRQYPMSAVELRSLTRRELHT